MYPQVLKITAHGLPQTWISVEEAASDLVAGRVLYGFGETVVVLRGGYNRDGRRSELQVPAILTTRGSNKTGQLGRPAFSRLGVFARDQHMCMYCGVKLSDRLLTLDHILPQSRGGRTNWRNCISACSACNNRKADRTPEEVGMQLLGVPYEPNLYEHLYLQNRRIVADQMAYLAKGFRSLVVDC